MAASRDVTVSRFILEDLPDVPEKLALISEC